MEGSVLHSRFEVLEGLSAGELSESVERVVHEEKTNVASVIAHIAVMAEKKAHLELGYSSLFEYCLRKLRLSEGSVACRLQVANVCRRVPALLDALCEGKVSLTVAAKLAPVISAETAAKLLADCAGMTRRECEAYVASLAPEEPVSPGIRQRPERSGERPEEKKPGADANESSETETESMPASMPARPERPLPEPPSPGNVKPVAAGMFNVRFAAPDSFKAKLERLAEVLGVFAPERNLAEVLEKALDLALEQKDPERRNARRREREARTAARETVPEEPKPSTDAENFAAPPNRSRAVPRPLRDQVLERAGYRCEYRAPDGTRCSERTGLHIDHRDPFARGGATTKSNLRVLCAAHNRLEAEREFGRAFIAAKIDSRRRESASANS